MQGTGTSKQWSSQFHKMCGNRSKIDNEDDPVVEDEEPREFDDEDTREIGEDKFNYVIKKIKKFA